MIKLQVASSQFYLTASKFGEGQRLFEMPSRLRIVGYYTFNVVQRNPNKILIEIYLSNKLKVFEKTI